MLWCFTSRFGDIISRVPLYYLHDHKILRYFIDQPNLNMRQCKWLDVVKDYYYDILYQPRKANVVAYALSCKAVSASIKNLCLRMTVIARILEQILEPRVKAMKCNERLSI